MKRLLRSVVTVAWVACACVTGLAAQTELLGPSRYLCFDSTTTLATGDCQDRDSPFKDEHFEWFHFRDFEDLSPTGPGITMSADCGSVTGLGCPFLSTERWAAVLTDSVDEDDGAINGLGQTVEGPGRDPGQTIQADGPPGILITFDAGALGDFPTHAGLVWTDGEGLVQFEAWDAGGSSLGTLQGDLADGGDVGSTAEDRFFAVVHGGGVSAIRIANATGIIEIDHLQYGKQGPECVTDPDCDDGNACTIDICSAGACLATPGAGDADGDGFFCPEDCDDSDAAVFPGAPEVNDAIDNHCPGDAGAGLVDELLPDAGFDPADPTRFCWPPQAGANRYEVARSSRNLDGEISCEVNDGPATCVVDATVPETGVVSYYLARAQRPNPGSWGEGVGRSEGCVFEDCSDGLDNDQDGLTDCDDEDCGEQLTCMSAEYSFLNTLGDDVAWTSLRDFFGDLALDGTEYLWFAVTGSPTGPQQMCVQRADFYRDAYLALAYGQATAYSGNWEKYYRDWVFPWVGPITDSFPNYFGFHCTSLYSWCIDYSLGDLVMVVAPADVDGQEAYGDNGCTPGGSTPCTLTIRVGPTRLSACGF